MRNERFRPSSDLSRYTGFTGTARWDPAKIPLFAYAYPKLDKDEGARLSALQANREEQMEMMQEPIVYSVPTYRECIFHDQADSQVSATRLT